LAAAARRPRGRVREVHAVHHGRAALSHPEQGARYALERASEAGDAATYRASIYTPDQRYDYDLTLALGGEPALSPSGTEPPPPAREQLVAQLLAIAKQVTRKAGKARDDGLPQVWPRRVLRWKGPGRGA